MRATRSLCIKAGLLTGLVSLLSFGLAHAAFITPLAHPPGGTPYVQRLAVMFGAPLLFGALPTALTSSIAAFAWRETRSPGALASWRFGLVLATGFACGAMAAISAGALGPGVGGWIAGTLLAALGLALPALAGWRDGGTLGAVLLPLALVPAGALNAMFFVEATANVWTALFFTSILVIWTASGWWMERFARRFSGSLTRPGAWDPSAG